MFADHAQWRAVRQAFHDGMHYQPKVFEIASKVKVPARTAPRTAEEPALTRNHASELGASAA
jgi:hypothetical protein